jgi:hypothetical protein
MQINHPDIHKTSIQIEPEDIFKLLGDQQSPIDAHTSGLVKHYIATCLEISSPAGAIARVEAIENELPHEITIPGTTFHSGKIIGKMLRHSESYAFFLVTAGPEPEKLARKLLAEGNYLEGYIADLVASSIVESAADYLEEQVRILAKEQGMLISNRYSPGYCDWNVAEQEKLFRLFPSMCCGISLSESSLMNPVKSASGIIGLGSRVVYREYTCAICSMLNCQFRKTKEN